MKKIIFSILALIIVMGCQETFTDLEPLSSVTEVVYYKTPEHYQAAANDLYGGLLGLNEDGEFRDYGSDLISLPQTSGRGTNTKPTNDEDYWNDPYDELRDIHLLLDKVDAYPGDAADISEYAATAYFFRAYQYFFLLQRFGGVPIITSTLATGSEELNSARSSRYEVIGQVLSDLDLAINGLPASVGANDTGKITKLIAKAFKSKILLYEGTWEKNVGTTTDGDGTSSGAGTSKPGGYPSVGDMLSMSNALALEVMNSNVYSLWNHDFDTLNSNHFLFIIDGAGSNPNGLDKDSNNEFIFQSVFDFVYRQGGTNISHTNGGRLSPSRKFMDMFTCTDGLPIDKSSMFQGYATVADQFVDRDPRMEAYYYFESEVGYNSASILTTPSETSSGMGVNGRKFRMWGYPAYRANNQESMNLPLIRLAEIYLIYAETLFEMNGSITDAQLDASINMVRARADMPALTNAFVSANGLDMQEELRRERTIELFSENTRFHDLKRWGIAEAVLGEEIYGAVIEGTEYDGNTAMYEPSVWPFGEKSIVVGDGTTKRTIVRDGAANRNFALKHYLKPIPSRQVELSGITQNPGW